MLLPYLVLLQVGFAMPSLLPSPRCALTAPFHPYRPSYTFACEVLGGLLSVALSVGSRPPGVTWHPIRRSPDFPPPKRTSAATARPTRRPRYGRSVGCQLSAPSRQWPRALPFHPALRF